MIARSAFLIAAAALSAPALAAGPATPTKAQLDTAAFHLKVLMSALQSKEVDEPIKNALFVCFYENPFGKISDATTRVLTGNKLSPTDPNKVLTVMAGVCGFRPGGTAPPPPGVPPKGAAPKSGPPQQPKSR
ncbi:hypothetical protein [Sphingobium sp. CCH11-B1]|jgi:hypothetical protein|uniref:hypothetical protein n=1 Tax=Sphingobium sp. CCH11-B1 TaxID=1768781 RepID=UPI000832A252|nr:hypothetical protein [Sphingobium sp. CCH11-B1]MEA3390611.1 hypothetical protein [Pseudomonadota bacterium]